MCLTGNPFCSCCAELWHFDDTIPLGFRVISFSLVTATLLAHIRHLPRMWLWLPLMTRCGNEVWVWLFYSFPLWSLPYHLALPLICLEFLGRKWWPVSPCLQVWALKLILSLASSAATFAAPSRSLQCLTDPVPPTPAFFLSCFFLFSRF